MAILKRCIAVTNIFTIRQSSTREISSLVSRRMTDRRCRKNHYGTSHQAKNVEKTEDSLRGRGNLRTFLDRDKTGDMRRRGDSYIEKKNISQQENVGDAAHLGRTLPQLRRRPSSERMKRKTKYKLKAIYKNAFLY